MPDKEKVMQWLATCVSGCEEGCPYEYENLVYRVECKADLMRDALALLKEQETIVRCKDCVKRPDEHKTELNGELYRYCELHRRWTTDDWFCADGERR